MKQVTIYTDGACSGNPGPGGWGAILMYQDKRRELSGFAPETTNNRMELMAVIAALAALKEPCAVDVHTDSAYVCNAFRQHWIDAWLRNGWMTSAKKPVEKPRSLGTTAAIDQNASRCVSQGQRSCGQCI